MRTMCTFTFEEELQLKFKPFLGGIYYDLLDSCEVFFNQIHGSRSRSRRRQKLQDFLKYVTVMT